MDSNLFLWHWWLSYNLCLKKFVTVENKVTLDREQRFWEGINSTNHISSRSGRRVSQGGSLCPVLFVLGWTWHMT